MFAKLPDELAPPIELVSANKATANVTSVHPQNAKASKSAAGIYSPKTR